MTNKIKCKYCNSEATTKYGTYHGNPRYWCKVCKRKFTDNDALPKMKTNKRIIASALSCWYSGMPLDAIQRYLKQQFDIYFSESGIYNWVVRFSKQAIERTKDCKPNVGDTWIADETAIRTGGKVVWFWDIIDEKTRYLLASHVSKTRTSKDAEKVMRKAMK
ncbi:MAG: DDE-type integrase/transposase/recombinase [bacterium]|nr:DDE-type integrase/transposase/recombinase [bacterium]